MKVYITKYALTEGIIEAEGEPYGLELEWVSASWDDGYKCGDFEQGEWYDTKERAIQKAEEMRQNKIASLKKQIEKLERMRFE